MGTKLTELRDGCFARALDDEEMFVLLARDKHAPSHVRTWCSVRIAEIANGQRPASDMAQIIEAQQCADKMEKWRKEHDGEWRTGLFPDMTDDDRARFLAGDFPPITEAEEIALRPRTGDEAWELELAESEGGLLRVAASEAADLIGTLDERAMSVAKQIQERYKLSDAKRDRIAKNIADTLRKPGRRTAYKKAGVADPEKLERIAVRAMLPWYVWAVLLFAAGFIVGRIA